VRFEERKFRAAALSVFFKQVDSNPEAGDTLSIKYELRYVNKIYSSLEGGQQGR